MNFLRKNYLIIIVLLVALFLRFYHLSDTMTFLEDEGRDLLIMNRMIDTGRPVLLGPQTSTGNMYLGPLYYYIVTPALFLARMNPIGPVIFIALTGVFTVWLLYLMGTKWFGKFAGMSAAIMYAILPLPVSFTRNSWNPNLAPIFALLTIWYVVKIIEDKEYSFKNFFIIGLLAGSLIQMHYMAMLFLVGVGITLIIYLRRSIPTIIKGIIFAAIGFLVILSPFIAFEIRNDFVNTRAITRFIQAREEHNIRYALPVSLYFNKVEATTTRLLSSQFGRDSLSIDPYRQIISIIISLIILGGLFSVIRKKDSQSQVFNIIFLVFIIPLLFTGIYQENIHLHYLGFFFPLTYLLVSSTFRSSVVWNKVSVLLAASCIIYATPQVYNYLTSNRTNQVVRAQEVANYIVKESRNEPYNVVSSFGTFTTPFLYFVTISSHPPTTDAVPLVFLVCQGKPCDETDFNNPAMFLTGPAHPSIGDYLGHPLINSFEDERFVLSNDHVSNGAWVAKINVKIKE